jgi:hypothetical protein
MKKAVSWYQAGQFRAGNNKLIEIEEVIIKDKLNLNRYEESD